MFSYKVGQILSRLIYGQTCFYGLMVLKEITVYSAVVGSIYQRIPSTKLLHAQVPVVVVRTAA